MCYLPVSILCRVKMNNALGHIKSYISLIGCFVCFFKFPCTSCGEVFVFVSDQYLYRHCVLFCCCIKFLYPSFDEVFVFVSSLYLDLYQDCICINIVLFSVVVSNSPALPAVRYDLRRGRGIICPDYHRYLTKRYVGGVIVLAMYGWNIELHLRTSV